MFLFCRSHFEQKIFVPSKIWKKFSFNALKKFGHRSSQTNCQVSPPSAFAWVSQRLSRKDNCAVRIACTMSSVSTSFLQLNKRNMLPPCDECTWARYLWTVQPELQWLRAVWWSKCLSLKSWHQNEETLEGVAISLFLYLTFFPAACKCRKLLCPRVGHTSTCSLIQSSTYKLLPTVCRPTQPFSSSSSTGKKKKRR